MKINGAPWRSIWVSKDNAKIVQVIDQRFLPHQLVVEDLQTSEEAAAAIKEMHVRGAPLIGITAAYGIYLAMLEANSLAVNEQWNFVLKAADELRATRPTAINLMWAIDKMLAAIENADGNWEAKTQRTFSLANQLAEEDVEMCRMIGVHGLSLIEEISKKKNGQPVNILTHCNAGWLATTDYGTATSPMYHAHDKGIPIHVWVDETRPRNQGALTAWELGEHGIPHTYIADNTGGHLMQHGMVDLVIVGSDRTTFTGDVANKIGTYLKALAAKDNSIPFYVALPASTFDWQIKDGLAEIPIETRDAKEISSIRGFLDGKIQGVQISPIDSAVANYGFDVTPARLVTGLITERGICQANAESIFKLFPEQAPNI